MQRVVLGVLRRRVYRSGDTFGVYGDGGTGSIVYGRAISDAPVPFWPGAALRAGHLLDGHGVLPHLDSVQPDGHLEGLHVLGEHFWPSRAIVFETPEYYFGVVRHAVRTYDHSGNCRPDEPLVVETVVNSSPRAPSGARLWGYDAQLGQVILAFEASPELEA
jgi:hypothetical protein